MGAHRPEPRPRHAAPRRDPWLPPRCSRRGSAGAGWKAPEPAFETLELLCKLGPFGRETLDSTQPVRCLEESRRLWESDRNDPFASIHTIKTPRLPLHTAPHTHLLWLSAQRGRSSVCPCKGAQVAPLPARAGGGAVSWDKDAAAGDHGTT